ncbi:UbiA prenyltransferase family [Gymnopilus junonius]|uniref:UbiA prenyltransferase family n=1 Tax=Gymnopilus junonius TaxID=109634 RepID=A0A9P5NLR4_GYMJU|nr:UbiA prenyltransferase family [Gymnopilus junonius]
MACTINDMCDYEYDYQVERTKDRPLASGRISLRAASAFLIVQVLLFGTALWTSNKNLVWYRIACIPLIFMYPLMKRITHLPQAWLGIAINWGSILAWTTVYGSLNFNVIVPLLGGLWAWTMFYDTIYACQDRKDDAKIGIGSSALVFEDKMSPILSLLASAFIIFLASSLRANGHSSITIIFTVALATYELGQQIKTVDPVNPESYKGNLARNARFGFMLWFAMLVEYLLI